jgi:hypothetical protein
MGAHLFPDLLIKPHKWNEESVGLALEMWEKDPISMFCGFPVILATLPIFDAVGNSM